MSKNKERRKVYKDILIIDMRLIKARIKGYRSIIDTDYFEIEKDKTILVGPNEAGKTAILQALQKLNPPEGVTGFDSLRDYPRAKFDEDIIKRQIDPSEYTVVEGHFILEEEEKESFPEEYHNIECVCGVYLDNKRWYRIDKGPNRLKFSDIEKNFLRIYKHFEQKGEKGSLEEEYKKITEEINKDEYLSLEEAKLLLEYLTNNISNLDEENDKENERYDQLKKELESVSKREDILKLCKEKLPKIIYFSNYFKIKPVLHLEKLNQRISSNILDDTLYDYGNTCLLKFLGFTAKELAEVGKISSNSVEKEEFENYRKKLDERDYKLNAATVRLTNTIKEVWNPKNNPNDVNKLRIKVDGQYLKVVVEDEVGVEVELDQRSEGFQWLVSFYVVFFAEATDKYKNAILLLDEPGVSLHALKQGEFRETISKLSEKNQTIYTTHSPFLVGSNELEKVRVVEMIDRQTGTKIHKSMTAKDNGAILPLQEALGYNLAQSLFFHQKNLVLEGITDMWYLETISNLLKSEGEIGINEEIALIPANSASKIVYFATILHAQDFKVAALLDSDTAGDEAAKQDTLVLTLGTKRILRTKDVCNRRANSIEIEDLFRETIIKIAKERLGWEIDENLEKQEERGVISLLKQVAKEEFSKYKLAKAFVQWSKEKTLEDLTEEEIKCSKELIKMINKALK